MKTNQVINIIPAQSLKKYITLFFLLFLVGMPVFFSVYTIIEKKIIEYRMEEKLERESLQTIIIDVAAVIWVKENKEILINGEPFDIKKITRKGNTITVTGLYDFQEKRLHRLLAYNHSQNKSLAKDSILLLIFTTYWQVNEPLNLITPFFINKKAAWQNLRDKIYSLYYEIIIPPPRLV